MSDAPTAPPPSGAPPEGHRLPFRQVTGVGIAALLAFGGAVLFVHHMLAAETLAALPNGEAPVPNVGQEKVGIVNQKMFELEGRAERLRRDQLQRLASYGWVDRDAGVIHIPIQRAMDETVQELSRGGGTP